MEINSHNFEFLKFQDLSAYLKTKILMWRNHESIRKWMYNKNSIKLEDHLSFIDSLTLSSDKLYYLVKRDDVPFGVFSIINIKNSSAEWGYYLAPELHDKHYGVEFYYATLTFCFEYLKMKSLTGYALTCNRAANSLNRLFGFEAEIIRKPNSDEDFNFVFLSKKKWDHKIVNNKKILKLLELTKIKSYD